MKNAFAVNLLFWLVFLLAACTPAQSISSEAQKVVEETPDNEATITPAVTSTSAAPIANPSVVLNREPIILPISLFIVNGQDDVLDSSRNVSELEQIYDRVNEIWAPAGIKMQIQAVQELELPSPILRSIFSGDFQPFFNGLELEFSVSNPSLLNGFYAQNIGGPNGIVPARGRIFFVTDEPSVHDERVSAHEIGHILGLHHTVQDDGRLMFPGTNGMSLTDEEIGVARYVAQGLLDRMR